MMEKQLNPCPFCRGVEIHPSYIGQPAKTVFILCYGCGAQGPRVLPGDVSGTFSERDWERAIDLWNTRHITADDVPERIKREIQAEALEKVSGYICSEWDKYGEVRGFLEGEAAKIREGE